MHTVQKRQVIADNVTLLTVDAPEIAERARAGSYVVAQASLDGKKHPFFIAGVEGDSVLLVVTDRNDPDRVFDKMKKGAEFATLIGPIGRPLPFGEHGNVCIITNAEGLGAMCHVAYTFSQYNNKVFMIAGFRGRKQRFWESKIKKVAHRSLLVTHRPEENVNSVVAEFHNMIQKKHMDLVVTHNDLGAMRGISQITHQRTRSLSIVLPPIGDDYLGLTSSCRMLYDNEPKLNCIEGPAFESHRLDWDYLLHIRGSDPIQTIKPQTLNAQQKVRQS